MKLVQLNEDLEHLSDELKDRVAVALNDTEAQVALETDEKKKEVKKDTKPAVDVTNEVAKETNADGKAKEIFESVSKEETNEMSSALSELVRAFNKVSELWESGISGADDALLNGYPFDKSFDEIATSVNYWVDEIQDKINNGYNFKSYDESLKKKFKEALYSVKDLDDKEVEKGSKHDSKGIRNILIGSLKNASKEDLLDSLRQLLDKSDDATVIKLLKSLNNYDIKKLKEDVEDVVIDKEEVIEEPKDFGINSAITQLIKQGWENIDQVNSYLATFESAPEGVKNALQSIIDDNMIHIGALEGLYLNPEINIEDEEEKLELK